MHTKHMFKVLISILFMSRFLFDLDIDDCDPNPCQNSGVCTDGINEHTCQCQEGFEGDQCDISKFITILQFVFNYS